MSRFDRCVTQAGMSDPQPIVEYMTDSLITDRPAWNIDLIPSQAEDQELARRAPVTSRLREAIVAALS